MTVKTFLGFLLGAIMVGLFLVQMWELFVQFHSGMKAIAISFEERDEIEFPSFAICDSNGFRKRTYTIPSEKQYNASTFDMEGQVTLSLSVFGNDNEVNDQYNYTSELFATLYNGYCMLYEFHQPYPPHGEAGNNLKVN